MKKSELIDKLFNEFVEDKDLIKKNLMQVMDIVMLEAKNEDMSVLMTIKVSRKDEE